MRIQGYDHVGIRVSDAGRALEFYGKLGFRTDLEFSDDAVAEIVADDGTRINLIFNGVARESAHNILLDEPTKWPGYTHGAFIVDSLQEVIDWAASEGIKRARIQRAPALSSSRRPSASCLRSQGTKR